MKNILLFEAFSANLDEQSYWDQFPSKDGWIMKTSGGGFNDSDKVTRVKDDNFDFGFRDKPLVGKILHIFVRDNGEVAITARFIDENGTSRVESFKPEDLKLA
jgi:hypothetical protein